MGECSIVFHRQGPGRPEGVGMERRGLSRRCDKGAARAQARGVAVAITVAAPWSAMSTLMVLVRLLECAAALGPARASMSQRPSGPGPPKPTTYPGIKPTSTQKTSLIGEDCPRLICWAPPSSITDVGLNLLTPS